MIQPEAHIMEYPRCKPPQKYLKEKSNQDDQTKRSGKQSAPLPVSSPILLSNDYRNTRKLFSSIPHSMLDNLKPKNIYRLSIKARLALELSFKMTSYPSHVDKQRLSQSCSMSYRQIDIWFQNRRDRGPGAKQQSKILPQIDSLEQLRQTFQQLLLLGSTRKKSMDSCQLEVEDFQSSASDSDVNSEDDTSEDPELPNFTYEESRFSRPLVESLNTQSSENEAAFSDEESEYIHSSTPQSGMTFLKPYQKPRLETVSKFFSFPAPQWIRQRSTKPCPKSIPRAACDIDMSIDFGSLHVTKVGRTSPSGTIVTVTPPENNSNQSKENSSIRGFPRKVAPLPRRHASPNTVITTKESSTDELPALHPRSVSSSSASPQLNSEDGGLSDHSSSSSLVTKDAFACTMSSQNLSRSRNVVRRNGTMHALSRRKRC